MLARTSSALAGLACAVAMLVLSTPVLAAGYSTATIQIDDLDLDSREGMAMFERRIRAAAREICGPADVDPRIESKGLCFSEVRAVAMSKAELTMGEKPVQTPRR